MFQLERRENSVLRQHDYFGATAICFNVLRSGARSVAPRQRTRADGGRSVTLGGRMRDVLNGGGAAATVSIAPHAVAVFSASSRIWQ
jgi:hypothetical protein